MYGWFVHIAHKTWSHLLKLYLIYMFKVMPVNKGIKGISAIMCKEIDLAQFWRQMPTAKEVSGREERH
ncbi:hypothetical protein C9F04_23220 [Salmonella enterica subsp. enterica serovar Wilhelmsburg]|uniref:Uncharacterized protein n=2 Tax=Salmonella enterica I TaxID=59201 RepID=A0A4Z0K955_SALET|nr:hypothetical protein BTN68_23870 [Salmonella enterica subsp. enterica serovar Enteritidis]EBU6706029.1 hypothetical protein [Salmonella enterica subsp. enterica serovar Mbandaka]TGC77739.1 hypothetical protein C9F04_23220 [Salmonella enterica subsp. enterica serovar Wilhelmsburg]TGD27147.1 hypothetical protein C9F10_19855 [Salmonella enterica subsp. enterica serovar Poona]PVP38865.1 hypothetical protein C4742_19760 [Salmonella enterica subsp. enterica serovar Mbandaka]